MCHAHACVDVLISGHELDNRQKSSALFTPSSTRVVLVQWYSRSSLHCSGDLWPSVMSAAQSGTLYHLAAAPPTLTRQLLSLVSLKQMSVANKDRRMPEHHARMHAFNPSVARLPAHYAAALGATYIVSFRAGNHNNCHQVSTPRPVRYVGPFFGFRLLDRNLELVPATEALVDFSRSEGWVTKKGGHHDCRLHANATQLLLGCGPSLTALHLATESARSWSGVEFDCEWPLHCPWRNATRPPDPFGARHVVRAGLSVAMTRPFSLLADVKAKNLNVFFGTVRGCSPDRTCVALPGAGKIVTQPSSRAAGRPCLHRALATLPADQGQEPHRGGSAGRLGSRSGHWRRWR